MIEEELIKIWQSSPNQEVIKFEKSRLMLDVQSHLDRFQRGMKWLYLREALGAIIAIPIFIYFAFDIPHLISKIGAALIVKRWLPFPGITEVPKNGQGSLQKHSLN